MLHPVQQPNMLSCFSLPAHCQATPLQLLWIPALHSHLPFHVCNMHGPSCRSGWRNNPALPNGLVYEDLWIISPNSCMEAQGRSVPLCRHLMQPWASRTKRAGKLSGCGSLCATVAEHQMQCMHYAIVMLFLLLFVSFACRLRLGALVCLLISAHEVSVAKCHD